MGQGFEAVLRALGGFASVEVEPEDLQNSSSSARGRQVGGGIGAARATYAVQRGDQSAGTEAFGKTWASWGQPWSASASPPRAAAAWRAVTATAVGLRGTAGSTSTCIAMPVATFNIYYIGRYPSCLSRLYFIFESFCYFILIFSFFRKHIHY